MPTYDNKRMGLIKYLVNLLNLRNMSAGQSSTHYDTIYCQNSQLIMPQATLCFPES